MIGSEKISMVQQNFNIAGNKPLLGNFGAPSTLHGGIHLPLGVSSISSNNLVSNPPDLQRRIA